MKDNILHAPLEHDLDLLLGVDGFHKNIADSRAFCAPHICKKLISDKDRIRLVRPHKLHGADVVLGGRLVRIVDIMGLDLLIEHLHALLSVVLEKT